MGIISKLTASSASVNKLSEAAKAASVSTRVVAEEAASVTKLSEAAKAFDSAAVSDVAKGNYVSAQQKQEGAVDKIRLLGRDDEKAQNLLDSAELKARSGQGQLAAVDYEDAINKARTVDKAVSICESCARYFDGGTLSMTYGNALNLCHSPEDLRKVAVSAYNFGVHDVADGAFARLKPTYSSSSVNKLSEAAKAFDSAAVSDVAKGNYVSAKQEGFLDKIRLLGRNDKKAQNLLDSAELKAMSGQGHLAAVDYGDAINKARTVDKAVSICESCARYFDGGTLSMTYGDALNLCRSPEDLRKVAVSATKFGVHDIANIALEKLR